MTIYALAQNNRINEVMKGLSIISAFALPPVIIGSIYGMNFDHMPELQWQYGYLFALLLSAGISLGLLSFFRFKRWL